MQLSPQTIRLGATPRNKNEAIELAGIALVDAGYIERAYIQSMMGRELQANTCLGRGIAIPHGMALDRHLIKQTGVAVVQMPQGVDWNADERVELLFAIAAKSDEHLPLLTSLMDVLDDEALIERLSNTTDVTEIMAALNGPPPMSAERNEVLEGLNAEAKMGAPDGLHARPATRLVQLASQFDSQITLEFGTQRASAKAMVALLKLGIPGGASVRIWAHGDDAQRAIATLRSEIESGLGDEISIPTPLAEATLFVPTSNAPFLSGVKASPGLAIARLHVLGEEFPEIRDEFSTLETELAKFNGALQAARGELQAMAQGTREGGAIFAAQAALLEDFELWSEVENTIEDGHGAVWAWHTVISDKAVELRANSNARLAERSVDLQDIGVRVLRHLGVSWNAHPLPNSQVILVARDLTPSQTGAFNRSKILGICLAQGGATSHTAILARSLGIPAVVGVGDEILNLKASDSFCILDGTAGKLYCEPTDADLTAARALQVDNSRRSDAKFTDRFRPALTRDGHRVEVVANIGEAFEAAVAIGNGAEGVGLLRTEIQFLGRDSAPCEEEQFQSLAEITGALGGLPLVVRTLDIGGDKTVPYLNLAHEDNPFLGVRGVRLTLRHPEIFATQLRAIFRASENGPLRILFPMIGSLEEWRAARDFAEKIRLEMNVLEVEYGVMIEVPAAVLMARELAEEVDFFSIGTNDLTQYTLAIDRMHPELGRDLDALHPAVLRLIDMTVRAAREAGKWVGVCGGLTDEPLGALILTGLGVSELSMSVPAIPGVKAALRNAIYKDAQELAERALRCGTAAQVRALGGQI